MSRALQIFVAVGLAGLGCVLLFSLVGAPGMVDGVSMPGLVLLSAGYLMVLTGTIGAVAVPVVRLLRAGTA